MIRCHRAGNTPCFLGRVSPNVRGNEAADRVSRIVAGQPRLTSMCTSWHFEFVRPSMPCKGATRTNFSAIVAKARLDGRLPAIQPVLRTGDDRRITVKRSAPRDALYAHMAASTPTLDLARRMAKDDTVGWLGAPVGRGIFRRLFKVFGNPARAEKRRQGPRAEKLGRSPIGRA
jgi:hypothetical protein